MDLPWGHPISKHFLTSIGLITSNGPHGQNIMAAEWTFHISYTPGLLAVCINPHDATHDNIHATKEFGVSLCASDQASFSSIAGGSSGKNVDKIASLKKLGVVFYAGKQINVPMVESAAVNVECKLVKKITLGDHTMFVGEIVEASSNESKQPIIYHEGKYFEIGKHIPKPPQTELDRIQDIIKDHQKK